MITLNLKLQELFFSWEELAPHWNRLYERKRMSEKEYPLQRKCFKSKYIKKGDASFYRSPLRSDWKKLQPSLSETLATLGIIGAQSMAPLKPLDHHKTTVSRRYTGSPQLGSHYVERPQFLKRLYAWSL